VSDKRREQQIIVNILPASDLIKRFLVPPGKRISLQLDFDPGYKPEGVSKLEARDLLRNRIQMMASYQEMLYAQSTYGFLIILQGIDASGKDSLIRHVTRGLNPQGCQVYSFKAPSDEELNHDYMWRCFVRLPGRGYIGIFNRSYYEEVVVVRVHPELLERQRLPPEEKSKGIWKRRFEEINNFECYLTNNGIQVIKVYLNVSKEEQRRRLLDRIERPEKHWKFSLADVHERAHWNEYLEAYEDVLHQTSTRWAPWYVVPADRKWSCRLAVSNIICARMDSLHLQYPKVDEGKQAELAQARLLLEQESDQK
jgi:PPK2 family polyphosphate:nucleotide phosphotransferase